MNWATGQQIALSPRRDRKFEALQSASLYEHFEHLGIKIRIMLGDNLGLVNDQSDKFTGHSLSVGLGLCWLIWVSITCENICLV